MKKEGKEKKIPAKKRKINLLRKLKIKPLKVSVSPNEVKLIRKEIRKYKMNLLRNRPIAYVLKNLGSTQRLSFAKKNILNM